MLTNEQKAILAVVEDGHNIFLTGQAGSGKSFLLNAIYRRLTSQGKHVVLLCSSGIACTVYSDLNASTVHSHYGLLTAELPWNLLLDRAVSKNEINERIRKSDVIIWDECSMSSARIFELVNLIHHNLASPGNSTKPFGGKQIVLSGEFLQLRPVPNLLDEGKFLYASRIFMSAIPHRYELTTILRQERSEDDFLNALKEIRTGTCTKHTEEFLQSLSRPLPQNLENSAVHVYFKKLATQIHNQNQLMMLPGELYRLVADDKNVDKNFKCPAENIIQLKPGCKVMLLWNTSNKLKNGTVGQVEGRSENGNILVKFAGVGTSEVKRETWYKVGRSGEIEGSRTQFPLTLAYAVTCHKAQGLTLPAAIIHCSKEFVSGLMYVAITRVKSKHHLQVLNFKSKQLQRPPTESMNVCNAHIPPNTQLDCCRGKHLEENMFIVQDRNEHIIEGDEEKVDETLEEKWINTYFERGDADCVEIDLATVYAVLSDDSVTDNNFRLPPDTLNVNKILESFLVDFPKTEFAATKNEVIQDMINNKKQETETLVKIMWQRICSILLKQTDLNTDMLKISSKDWTNHMKGLYLLITRDTAYFQDIRLYFSVEAPTKMQSTVIAQLMLAIYNNVIEYIASKVHDTEVNSSVSFNVRDMPAVGLAKVRHVGAWAIRSVLSRLRKYVHENMPSTSARTQQSVREQYTMCELIEEYLVAEFQQLEDTTKYAGTLDVTEDRQYRNRGLSHIEDSAFEFVLRMEELRVANMNEVKLAKHKEALVQKAIEAVKCDKDLWMLWNNCFTPETRSAKQEPLKRLFGLITCKYMEAGAGQFLRDFRRAHRMKKSAEHRKKVLQKKQSQEEKKAVIAFAEILKDASPGKRITHMKLDEYAKKFGEKALATAYNKSQLQSICKAYNVRFNTKTTKARLTTDLVVALTRNDAIPSIRYLLS